MTLHERVAHLAATQPDRTAVVAGDIRLTYAELDARANQVAWRLRALGVDGSTLVGLGVDRSADMVVGLLAILKAGGAYVPLDPGYPAGRLKLILDDSRAPVVVTQRHLVPRWPAGPFEVLALDDAEAYDGCPTTDPGLPARPDDIAYVIYTSGSTGVPKGVLTTHDNVANLIREQSYLSFEPADRVAAIASLSFDASTLEIWGALLTGAACHVYPFAGSDLDDLFERVHQDAITVLALTSPVFRVLEPGHFALAKSVRAMFFGGDSVRTDVVVRARQLFPGELIHVYGPTETTSFATVLDGRTEDVESPLFPIGLPIRGVTVRILGPDGAPVAAGEEGELYIGGRGVACGYLNRPALTADRFVPDPTGPPGSRLYRTGDLVRAGRRGELHFLGRLDRQLKIRGHRIEPAEIEAALTRHAEVSDAVVVGRPDGAGDKRLHAYLVRAEPDPATDRDFVDGVRRYVGAVLPTQHHPATFTVIETIPFTDNLKLDQSRLPEPGEPERASVRPSDRLEVALAALWSARLDVRDIGVDDDFFTLGGDSMLALQVAAASERAIGVPVNVGAILRHPTIRKLAAALAQGRDQA